MRSLEFRALGLGLARIATAATLLSSCGGDSDEFIKGVDVMNQAKDRVGNPRTNEEMLLLADYAKALGATHVALATPYDGEGSNGQTGEWVHAIRDKGLSVSHRHMFVNFEGIYGEEKISYPEIDYVDRMRQWMIDHQDLIQNGDTWTPVPEPQNGGIKGVNCNDKCIFDSKEEFNEFIRKIVTTSREALKELDKNVEVVCCGFDGFIVAGLSNSDHEGKNSVLEKETVNALGHIAIDHSPQPKDGKGERPTYRHDLEIITKMWPGVPLYITEFGTINGVDLDTVTETFKTFKEYEVNGTIKGVWWWQMGPSGAEALIVGPDNGILNKNNTSKSPNFDVVREGFSSLP